MQDIIWFSKSDRQQTIDALFDMFPNTNRVEERPSEDEESSLWKIPLLWSKLLSFGLSNLMLLILHERSSLLTLHSSVVFTPIGL